MKAISRSLYFVLAFSSLGCEQLPKTCWDPVPQEPTGINPTAGNWSANTTSTDPALNQDNDQNPVRPLSHRGFSVVAQDATTSYVDFSADGYLWRTFPINSGAFSFVHGNNADATVCPTEGYVISGHFTSTTEASGRFLFIPGCVCQNCGDFIANLQP